MIAALEARRGIGDRPAQRLLQGVTGSGKTEVYLRVAAAGVQLQAARLMMVQDCVDAQAIAAAGRVPAIEEKLRFKRNLAYAVGLCTEAVDGLHIMAGANGIYDAYPIQRLFRDAHALAAHIAFSWDAQGSSWGLAALGGEIVNPTL